MIKVAFAAIMSCRFRLSTGERLYPEAATKRPKEKAFESGLECLRSIAVVACVLVAL